MRHVNVYTKYIEAAIYYFSLGFWYIKHSVSFRIYTFQKHWKYFELYVLRRFELGIRVAYPSSNFIFHCQISVIG